MHQKHIRNHIWYQTNQILKVTVFCELVESRHMVECGLLIAMEWVPDLVSVEWTQVLVLEAEVALFEAVVALSEVPMELVESEVGDWVLE